MSTNDEATAQVVMVLHDVGVTAIQVDLPFGTMYLIGMLWIVDRDLA